VKKNNEYVDDCRFIPSNILKALINNKNDKIVKGIDRYFNEIGYSKKLILRFLIIKN
jgi:hypothetical protein|tara:strand:- start:68 stop:238 length:171 start_codon:yes stop_codon:yes gene_type:complete